MEHEVIDFETKRIEKDLSRLGAKVADALALLTDVQQGIEELYISLDDADDQK